MTGLDILIAIVVGAVLLVVFIRSMMFTKVLRPLMSGDGKLVLAAVEKIAGSSGGIFRRDRRGDYEAVKLFESFTPLANLADMIVIGRSISKFEADAQKHATRNGIRKTAGEILMGGQDESKN